MSKIIADDLISFGMSLFIIGAFVGEVGRNLLVFLFLGIGILLARVIESGQVRELGSSGRR